MVSVRMGKVGCSTFEAMVNSRPGRTRMRQMKAINESQVRGRDKVRRQKEHVMQRGQR